MTDGYQYKLPVRATRLSRSAVNGHNHIDVIDVKPLYGFTFPTYGFR